MKVSNMILNGNWLVLVLDNPREAAQILDGFQAGEYKLSRQKKARSLDANAYCWALVDRIADKVGLTPVEVYREMVRNIGGKIVYTCVQEDDVETEAHAFVDGHLGRLVDVIDSRIQGCVTLRKHYGSSDYNTEEMSRLIDAVVQECRQLGIETRPQEEIDSLLGKWGRKHG